MKASWKNTMDTSWGILGTYWGNTVVGGPSIHFQSPSPLVPSTIEAGKEEAFPASLVT